MNARPLMTAPTAGALVGMSGANRRSVLVRLLSASVAADTEMLDEENAAGKCLQMCGYRAFGPDS
eukprot:scaffold105327_cov69-Phaeocystis_antarctica.AAC.4